MAVAGNSKHNAARQRYLVRSFGLVCWPDSRRTCSPGASSSSPDYITTLGDLVIFVATSPDFGREVWRSDGTENGTYALADLYPGTGSSAPRYLVEHDGHIYFRARDQVRVVARRALENGAINAVVCD